MTRFEQTEASASSGNRQAPLSVSMEEMQAFQSKQGNDSNKAVTPHQAADSLYLSNANHVKESNLSSIYDECSHGGKIAAQHLSRLQLEWRPNANDHSSQAMEWQKERQAQANSGLNLESHANYAVQRGDTLSDIAKRSLIGRGAEEVTGKDVQREMLRIMQENKDRYPDLAKNPDFLRPGMKLYVGDACQAGALPKAGSGNEFPQYSKPAERESPPPDILRSLPGALGQPKEEVQPSELKPGTSSQGSQRAEIAPGGKQSMDQTAPEQRDKSPLGQTFSSPHEFDLIPDSSSHHPFVKSEYEQPNSAQSNLVYMQLQAALQEA